jgi:hypothetical protein
LFVVISIFHVKWACNAPAKLSESNNGIYTIPIWLQTKFSSAFVIVDSETSASQPEKYHKLKGDLFFKAAIAVFFR